MCYCTIRCISPAASGSSASVIQCIKAHLAAACESELSQILASSVLNFGFKCLNGLAAVSSWLLSFNRYTRRRLYVCAPYLYPIWSTAMSGLSADPLPASPRKAYLLLVIGILTVLAVRISLLRQVSFCGVPDSCSYLSLAQSLDQHRGFQVHFADNLQLDHVTLPATGIEYWRPGTSFFLLLVRPFVPVTLHSSLFVTVLAGLLLAAAAWHIAVRFNGDRSLAAFSVLLCLVLPAVWDSSLIADSGLYYAAAVAWFLALFTVRSQGYFADALALVCVALAYLVRNDAVILIIPLLVVLLQRRRYAASGAIPARGSSPAYCVLIVAGFLLALAPMHLIDLSVLGQAFPHASSRVLFFNDLNDIGRYGSLANLHSWLAVGVGKLVKLRLVTLPVIIYRIIFVLTGFGLVFVPLLLVDKRSATPRAQLPEMEGNLTFLATVLVVYGLVLPAIGVFSALRSSFALFPFFAVLILVAIARFVPGRAGRMLAAGVIVYYLVSGIAYGKRIVADLEKEGERTRHSGEFLHAQGVDLRTARVISDDPDQLSATTGYSTIQLPSNGVEAVALLAHDLHATHLLLDMSAHAMPLAELQSHLHPVAVTSMPDSHIILLSLPPLP